MDELPGAPCDTCGRWYAFCEMAETLEEYLCESCASGIDPDDLADSYDAFDVYDGE
jgi:hypothetical protein